MVKTAVAELDGSVSLFALLRCLGSTADMVSPRVADHQKRVAYIASGLSLELGLEAATLSQLVMAGLLHDLGALSLQEKLACLTFEDRFLHRHAEAGYFLLNQFAPLEEIATLVRHHHRYWDEGSGATWQGEPVPLESHILHLADRAEVLIQRGESSLSHRGKICRELRRQSGRLFHPDLVEAFLTLSTRDYFWFDLDSSYLDGVLAERSQCGDINLGMADLAEVGRLFGFAIDFRSHYTAIHSSGVGGMAAHLATLSGMTASEQQLSRVAGYMHDFGKLALPRELLEKPTKLSPDEYAQVRLHPYLTHRLLDPIPALRQLKDWISFHHERLDGTGYPFGLSAPQLPLGARVLAVADMLTALTEDRPYRAGMDLGRAVGVLQEGAAEGGLDRELVEVARRHAPTLVEIRRREQARANRSYRAFQQQILAVAAPTAVGE